jgi:drug/metabolite transporter superfamily protein YnfA
MIPLALAIDRERPNLLSLFGATVAVTGVILMLLLPHGN